MAAVDVSPSRGVEQGGVGGTGDAETVDLIGLLGCCVDAGERAGE
eukprot:gene41470-16276_t